MSKITKLRNVCHKGILTTKILSAAATGPTPYYRAKLLQLSYLKCKEVIQVMENRKKMLLASSGTNTGWPPFCSVMSWSTDIHTPQYGKRRKITYARTPTMRLCAKGRGELAQKQRERMTECTKDCAPGWDTRNAIKTSHVIATIKSVCMTW